MEAVLVFNEQYPVAFGGMAYMVVWQLPRTLPGSDHPYKYRLSLVHDGANVLRYDNEAGKGDHRHIGRRGFPYRFVNLDELLDDFWRDVEKWQESKRKS
jgi:hypothetical protein